jgi:hypothetical protein
MLSFETLNTNSAGGILNILLEYLYSTKRKVKLKVMLYNQTQIDELLNNFTKKYLKKLFLIKNTKISETIKQKILQNAIINKLIINEMQSSNINNPIPNPTENEFS